MKTALKPGKRETQSPRSPQVAETRVCAGREHKIPGPLEVRTFMTKRVSVGRTWFLTVQALLSLFFGRTARLVGS